MRNKIFVFALVFVFLFNFVAAQPPQTNINTNDGLEISYPKFETIKINQPFNLSVHVFNISDGVQISGATCDIEIYNHTGEHLLDTSLSSVGDEYNYYISSGNFTQSGCFSYNLYCNNSINGGFVDGLFCVTNTGNQQTTAQGINSAIYLILMISLTIFFAFVGFKLSESEMLWILGVFFLFLALLFITYDTWLGVEYYVNYIGLDNTSQLPQVIFYIYLGLLSVGIIVSALLLVKRLPKIIEWFRTNVLGQKGDSWDEGKFE